MNKFNNGKGKQVVAQSQKAEDEYNMRYVLTSRAAFPFRACDTASHCRAVVLHAPADMTRYLAASSAERLQSPCRSTSHHTPSVLCSSWFCASRLVGLYWRCLTFQDRQSRRWATSLSLLWFGFHSSEQCRVALSAALCSWSPMIWRLCFAGPPVEVGVTMYVLSISSVSEVLMVLTLNTHFQF